MSWKFLLISLLVAIGLTGCTNNDGSTETTNNEKDIKVLVQDYSTRQLKDKSASINGKELVVTKSDDSKIVYDLTNEDFFVSIAPYIDQTHPCTFHSLTGCQGELIEKEFDVLIQDSEGNTIVDERITSHPNGFIDLWLPRNKTYQVEIHYEGRIAKTTLSTHEEDPTCITTMQLL